MTCSRRGDGFCGTECADGCRLEPLGKGLYERRTNNLLAKLWAGMLFVVLLILVLGSASG